MKKIFYNKLVRDQIPDIIQQDGKQAITAVLKTEEKQVRLDQKLQEEVQEFLESHSIEEIADILEVLHAQASLLKVSWKDIEKSRLDKKEARGGFEQGILLLEVIENE